MEYLRNSRSGAGADDPWIRGYVDAVEKATAAAETDRSHSSGPRGHGTILLVDDDAQSCELARTILTHCGYTLLVANDVAGAQKWAASHPGPIHLLLTDLAVAGTAGREIARRVCATRRETRVLYMSSTSPHAIPNEALDVGARFLPKPFTASALVERVRAAMDEPASRA